MFFFSSIGSPDGVPGVLAVLYRSAGRPVCAAHRPPRQRSRHNWRLHRHCRNPRPPPAYAGGETFFWLVRPLFFTVLHPVSWFLSIPDLGSKREGEKIFLFSTGISATLGLLQPTPEVRNFFNHFAHCFSQCCGSGMFIPDPGSWFLSIPDLGSKRGGEKNCFVLHRHCCHPRPTPAYPEGEEFFLLSHTVFHSVASCIPDPDFYPSWILDSKEEGKFFFSTGVAATLGLLIFCFSSLKQVLRIRIRRIHMLLVLLDPDPFVRGTDPDLFSSSKIGKKNFDSYCFCDFFLTFYLWKNDVNVPLKSNKQKNVLGKMLSA